MRKPFIHSLTAVAALALATPALAHTGGGSTAGFAAGLLHPLTGFDHLLAILAVGAWSALAAPAKAWAPPLAFFLAMLAGAGLAFAGVVVPAAETGIVLSLLALGLLIGARVKLGLSAAIALVALFALPHGYAHGTEAAGGLLAYTAGFAATTAGLLALGVVIGRRLRSARRSQSTARTAGLE